VITQIEYSSLLALVLVPKTQLRRVETQVIFNRFYTVHRNNLPLSRHSHPLVAVLPNGTTSLGFKRDKKLFGAPPWSGVAPNGFRDSQELWLDAVCLYLVVVDLKTDDYLLRCLVGFFK
jgi:hypothetical protein